MKTYRIYLLLAGLLLVVLALLSGCKKEPPTGLYEDPSVNAASKPQPVISSITPPGGGLAGVTQITLAGTNFATVKENNFVYFDATLASILQASATQLVVSAPLYVKDSITVRVAVFGAQQFSPAISYNLAAAVEEFGKFQSFEEPWATTADADGNLYVSLFSNGKGAGIVKITPAGVRSDFALPGSVSKFSGIKMGPDGALYGVRLLFAVYRVAQGGSPSPWVAVPGSSLYDLDFDEMGNIWTGGLNATSLYRIKYVDKSVKEFPFTGDVRSVRYFGGYVYVGGRTLPDSAEKVIRFRVVNSDSLGPQEEYVNLKTSGFGGQFVYAINFAADGELYIGTDGAHPVLRVTPAKVVTTLYPLVDILQPTIHLMPWGKGPYMYAVKGFGLTGAVSSSQKILRIYLQKDGAPYFGRP